MERAAVAGLVALIVAAAACGGDPPPGSVARGALAPGEVLPAAWRTLPGSGTDAVVWVFRTDDCLTCQAMDYSLRRLQRTYGNRVALVAVHVGSEADASIPAAFFASRRLTTTAAMNIAPRDFRRVYGDVTLPVLLLAKGDTIAWSSVAPGEPRLTPARIDSVFAAGLGRRPAHPAVGARTTPDSSSHPSSAEVRS